MQNALRAGGKGEHMEWDMQFSQAKGVGSRQIDCTMSEAVGRLIEHAQSVDRPLEDTELVGVARQRRLTDGDVPYDFAAPIRPDGTDHRLLSR